MSWLIRRGSPTWIVRWYDADGIRRERSTRTTDKGVAKQIAAEIDRDVARTRAGLSDPRAERRARELRRPLSEHLSDFESHLTSKGSTSGHVAETLRRIRATLELAGVSTIGDVTPSSIQRALGRRKADHSDRGANKDLTAVRSMLRWMIQDGRIAEDPIAGIRPFRITSQPIRRRRALTSDECVSLIATAESGPVVYGLSGNDRAMLYRIALGTGFRARELASLTTKSFALDDKSPSIIVQAGHQKSRREDVQVIRRDLAEALRPWLASKHEGDRVFSIRRMSEKTSRMIRADLKAAQIAYETDAGVADFHALRHTFITALVAGGASPKVAQTLARHADPVLTLKVYTHAHLADVSRALESLPGQDLALPAALAATGTHPIPHPSAVVGGRKLSSPVATPAGASAGVNLNQSENAVRKDAAIAEPRSKSKWWARRDSNAQPSDYEAVGGRRKSSSGKACDGKPATLTQIHTLSLTDVAAELRALPDDLRQAALAAALKAIRAAKGGA